MGIKLNLKNVRIGWVNVFEKAKDSVDDKGNPVKGKYQATIYLKPDDPQINQLDATALQVLTEGMKSAKIAEKWMSRNFGFGNHSKECCVRDLAERDKPIEGLEEGLYLKASNQKRPLIMTSLGEKQTERGLTIDGDDVEGKEVYGGCYANVSIELFWMEKFKLLGACLLGVRFREDGAAFGGVGETANDDDLGDDDDAPARKPRASRRDADEDEEEEERPRRRSR